VQQVNHAYGTNGIITELEIPLGPAYPWAEAIAVFDDFMTAARFGQALGDADGLIKKLISIHAWPIPSYFAALRPYLPEGKAAALLMVAEPSMEPFQELVTAWGGTLTYQKSAQDAHKGVALAEFTWNHTTLHARSVDDKFTYLQTIFPYDPELKLVQHMYEHFGDEALMHLEFLRMNSTVIPAALQLVRYSTPERLSGNHRLPRGAGGLHRQPPHLCAGRWRPQNHRHRTGQFQGSGGSLRPPQPRQNARLAGAIPPSLLRDSFVATS
jgi:hypothetical protein